jgi:hypothetical protein
MATVKMEKIYKITMELTETEKRWLEDVLLESLKDYVIHGSRNVIIKHIYNSIKTSESVEDK